MLVPLLERRHALVRDASELRPMPDPHPFQTNSRAVLAAGGLAMFFEWEALLEDETIQLMHRSTSLGLYRLWFSDMAVERANYEPRPGWQNFHVLGGSPDG